MNKKLEKTIGDVLRMSNLSDNPGYYAGRTVEYGDITAKILLTVSENIKEHIGKKEQKIFNQMVFDLPTLKASFFIEFVVRLPIIAENGEWWWDKRIITHYYKDALKQPICEKTELIKQEFKKLMQLN